MQLEEIYFSKIERISTPFHKVSSSNVINPMYIFASRALRISKMAAICDPEAIKVRCLESILQNNGYEVYNFNSKAEFYERF